MAELTAASVEALRTAMSGTVSLPGDPAYTQACAIWNGAIDRRPCPEGSSATPAWPG